MRQVQYSCLLVLAGILLQYLCVAQTEDTIQHALINIPGKYFDKLSGKADDVENKIIKKTAKALAKLEKEEQRIRKKLAGIDSVAAKNIFAGAESKYDALRQKLATKAGKLTRLKLGSYIPYLDTVKTAMKFLQSNKDKAAGLQKEWANKLKSATGNIDDLENRFSQLADVQQYLKQRRQYLKQQLDKFGMGKELKRINKEVYYYSQMLKDYKEIFSDAGKIESHVLAALHTMPAFNNFVQQNSFLSSLFGSAANINADNLAASAASFTGLQTRVSVQQAVLKTAAAGGANPQQLIQQQLQAANGQLNALKKKIAFVDLSGNSEPMPDFKPNSQKTKPFLKRLELGANVQFAKTNSLLPATGDFAFSVGYKLNDKSIIGIGSSYKLGLGTITNIRFTHQGFGLRSFADWKLKKNLYISGGYEKNYLPQLQDAHAPVSPDVWQQSGLIGLSKKYSFKKKMKTSVQVLFDFLSYQNMPRSQPVLFRTGLNF